MIKLIPTQIEAFDENNCFLFSLEKYENQAASVTIAPEVNVSSWADIAVSVQEGLKMMGLDGEEEHIEDLE